MPSDMVGKHIIDSVKLQRPCLYIYKIINPNNQDCSLNCCQVRFGELAVKYCLQNSTSKAQAAGGWQHANQAHSCSVEGKRSVKSIAQGCQKMMI